MGPFLLIKSGEVHTTPGTKVIKAEQYAVCVKAAEMIRKAGEEARRITEQAREAYAAERVRGYQDGLLEGKARMAEQMAGTIAKTAAYFAGLEVKMVEIVAKALQKIVGEMDSTELITRVVRNALTIARSQAQISLRVHPAQADAVNTKLNDMMNGFPDIRFIDVIPDGRLEKGGCILETEMGIVDAGVDVQIEVIRRSLLKSFKGRKSS